jgi:two-component system sensor histidine kinase BaeS
MRSVFARIFSGLFLSSLAVLLAMSLVVGVAVRSSISHWNQGKKADLETVLKSVVSKVHRLNGGLSAGSLEAALSPYMTDSLCVYVFDERRHPVLLLDKGKRIIAQELDAQKGGIFQSLAGKHAPMEIKDDATAIGYLFVDNVDFLAYGANRQFIQTMAQAILIGIFVTLAMTLCVSALFSSSFSRQANALVAGLGALSRGERDARFPLTGTRELDMISGSAESLQRQLEKEERLRRQWMQDVSHDLRTPVAAMKAQLEAMLDRVLDISDARLSGLLAELNRVNALVSNLQELSRYESPEMTISAESIDSRLFLDDIRDRFSFLSASKGIAFECEGDGERFGFLVDEHLMQRCVSNIVQNAVQHAQSGGVVRVRLECRDADVELTVDNTGHISEQDLGRMFDRLYRGDFSRSEGGSGLGLSIAKAIVDLHGGTISAENVDGLARFTLRFPGRSASPPVGAAEATSRYQG